MKTYYVYDLIDPRCGEVFYVGKGTGDRLRHHVRGASSGRVSNSHKHRRIIDILNSGHQVCEVIVAEFDSEVAALRFERNRIQQFGDQLTNITSGTKSAEELAPDVAKVHLGRLKSFEHWAGTLSEYRMKAVSATGATLRQFYDAHVAFLRQVAEMR